MHAHRGQVTEVVGARDFLEISKPGSNPCISVFTPTADQDVFLCPGTLILGDNESQITGSTPRTQALETPVDVPWYTLIHN